MLPAPAAQVADDLLARLDRALPGRIDGFYVVGSACTGAFREGRSDVGLRRRWPLVANGIYLRPGDLAKSPSA